MNTKSISGSGVGILAVIDGLVVLICPELVRWITGIFSTVWGSIDHFLIKLTINEEGGLLL